MKNLKHLHAIEVSMLQATNSRGCRIKIKSHRFEHTVIIPYNYSFNGCKDGAQDWLESKGFELESFAMGKDSYIFMSSTFEPLK